MGSKKNGEIVYGIGVPSEIKQYIDEYFHNEHNLPIIVGGTNSDNSYLIVGRGNDGANRPYCVAVGIDVMTNNTGIKNITVGEDNMYQTTGHNNTSVGYHASFRNTSGTANAAFGSESQDDNTTGNYNASLGFCSLQRNNNGSYNVAIGSFALNGNYENHFDPENPKSFTGNVSIGADSLKMAQSGSNSNVAVGRHTLTAERIYENCIAIGYNVDCDKDNQTIIGNDDITETIVRGDFIVKGTDGKKRQIVFNQDNTCSWVEIN